MAESHDPRSDGELERLAAGGDRAAFGVLYERHCDAVHDFLLRMVRDPQEAADLTQETFVRAMRSMRAERAGAAAFRTWLFTIARNLALNRIERARRIEPLDDSDDDGGAPYRRIDPSWTADPEDAARARELASLVWRAAEALEPRQRTILDLHVRQGLESAEIAAVLGVTKGNAYTMLSRLKDAFEGAVAGLVMFQSGRRKCAGLDRALAERGATALSPGVRKLIDRHVGNCAQCQGERRQLVSASALLRAFVVLAVPAALRQHMAEAAWEGISASAGSSAAGTAFERDAGASGGGASGDGDLDDGNGPSAIGASGSAWSRRRRTLVVGLVAALVLSVLSGGIALAVARGHGPTSQDAWQQTPAATATVEARTVVPPLAATTPASIALIPTSTPVPAPPTAPRSEPTRAPPPAMATPTVVLAGALVAPTCDGFWSREPVAGEGFDHTFEAGLVALENADRAQEGLPPLVANDALYAIAGVQARYLAHSRTWSLPHIGADGVGFPDRIFNAGLLERDGIQHIDAVSWSWGSATENVFFGDGLDPCQSLRTHSAVHLGNWRGYSSSPEGMVTFPMLYHGTACYVLYATRAFTCVQDFVARQ